MARRVWAPAGRVVTRALNAAVSAAKPRRCVRMVSFKRETATRRNWLPVSHMVSSVRLRGSRCAATGRVTGKGLLGGVHARVSFSYGGRIGRSGGRRFRGDTVGPGQDRRGL